MPQVWKRNVFPKMVLGDVGKEDQELDRPRAHWPLVQVFPKFTHITRKSPVVRSESCYFRD